MIWENRSQKTSNLLEKNFFLYVFDSFFPFYAKRWRGSSHFLLFFKDCQDQFAAVALYKRAAVSVSILLIFKKERPWANWSRRSLKKSKSSDSLFSRSNRSFALSITKNEQFARKTDDPIPKPAIWALNNGLKYFLFLIQFRRVFQTIQKCPSTVSKLFKSVLGQLAVGYDTGSQNLFHIYSYYWRTSVKNTV